MADRTHYKSLIDTTYLGQWDFPPDGRGGQKEATVEITSVERYRPIRKRKVRQDDGTYAEERNKRLMIGLQGKRGPFKSWLAGPESQTILARMFGPVVQDWIGKKVTLYVDPTVKMRGVVTGGVRPRDRAPQGPLTEDGLDRPVDEDKAALIAQFFEDDQ